MGNTCIAVVCKSGCDVMNFKVKLIFLFKPFSYMTKKSWQKLKYLENEISFQDEIKSIFHHFSRTFNQANNTLFFGRWESGSSSCDYIDVCDVCILNGTITIAKETDAAQNNVNKKVIFKNCAPFTKCISRINNTLVDDALDIDVVMPMYNLI